MEKGFMLFTLYFVFNFNSESFNITGNAQVLHCLRVLGDKTKEQVTSSELKIDGSGCP